MNPLHVIRHMLVAAALAAGASAFAGLAYLYISNQGHTLADHVIVLSISALSSPQSVVVLGALVGAADLSVGTHLSAAQRGVFLVGVSAAAGALRGYLLTAHSVHVSTPLATALCAATWGMFALAVCFVRGRRLRATQGAV